jgi:hypothetical protein
MDLIMADENGRSLPEAAAEKPKELAREAGRGRSARTPLLALTGVTVVVAIVVAIVLAIALLVYFLA